jgi:gp067
VFASRVEAYEVLDRLNDQIKNFDIATVGDLLDLAGITSTHVDENWGWRTLATTQVRRVRDGYILDLERPVKI